MNKWSLQLLIYAWFLAALAKPKVLTCYFEYNDPKVDQIDPYLCTHLILIGSCHLDVQCKLTFPSEDVIKDILQLKQKNSQLKLILSLTAENPYLTKLVNSDKLLDAFIKALKSFLLAYSFDGFDVDWEFPVWSQDAADTDREGFIRLLTKLREVFDSFSKKPLLTIAVAGPYNIVEKAYDINALNKYVDLIQIMNYDFHIYAWDLPFTAFNAPLFRETMFEFGIASRMNSDYSTKYWLDHGLFPNKTVFGIPTYGRGFTLLSKHLHFLFAPAVGVSALGPSHSYWQVCNLTETSGYNYVFNEKAKSPYIYSGRQWLGLEKPISIFFKASYAAQMNLGGIMIFDLKSDDYEGVCNRGQYPLTKAAKSAFWPTDSSTTPFE